jgi:hypothetical protein
MSRIQSTRPPQRTNGAAPQRGEAGHSLRTSVLETGGKNPAYTREPCLNAEKGVTWQNVRKDTLNRGEKKHF